MDTKPGHEETILSACFIDTISFIATFNKSALISAHFSLTFGTRNSDVLSRQVEMRSSMETSLSVWKRSNQDADREERQVERMWRGGGAEPGAVCITLAELLTSPSFGGEKKPTASSRCEVGLQKFIRTALQAGYSRHKLTFCEAESLVCCCH